MAKQKRGNEYYLRRLEDEAPGIFKDWQFGRYPSVRKALEAAGLKNPANTLNLLISAWKKASVQQRLDFRAHIGAASPPTAKSRHLVDACQRLLPATAKRIRYIMMMRRIKMGEVMAEMGYNRSDPALGLAMSYTPTRLRNDRVIALQKWLDANKSIP